jgi:hypothetical protein
MTCNEIENRLPAYREDLLTPEERKIISGHLASCPRCNRAFAGLKKAEALVHGLGEVETPPFFEQRIMSRLREGAGRKQGILRRLFYPLYIKIPIQALATLLVTVLAFYVYQGGEPEMKQIAPLPIPLTNPEKSRVTVEAPRTLPPSSVAVPVERAPAGGVDLPEASRQRFVTPPLEAVGKEKRAADSRAVMRKEHLPAMKPSDPLMAAREEEPPPAGEETSNRTTDKAGKQDADKAFETLPQQQKRKEWTADTSAGVRVRESAKTAAATKRPVIDLTLRVRDIDKAIREIEARLGRVNVRIIDRKGSAFLAVEVTAQNVAALMELLEAIGRVNLERSPLVVPDGDATVSIKIVAHP